MKRALVALSLLAGCGTGVEHVAVTGPLEPVTTTVPPTTTTPSEPVTTTTEPVTTTTEAPATTVAPTRPKPTLAPAQVIERPAGNVWDRLAQCESGGNWATNTGNGYSGGLQFHPDTWRRAGGTRFAAYAWQATRAQQIEIAEAWLALTSWSQWPACSKLLGLR